MCSMTSSQLLQLSPSVKCVVVVLCLAVVMLMSSGVSFTFVNTNNLHLAITQVDGGNCSLAALSNYSSIDLQKQLTPPFSKKYKNPCWFTLETQQALCVPYVWLAGFPKSGTTNLYARLARHPYITSRVKEPHYISRTIHRDSHHWCNQHLEHRARTSCEILIYVVKYYIYPANDIIHGVKKFNKKEKRRSVNIGADVLNYVLGRGPTSDPLLDNDTRKSDIPKSNVSDLITIDASASTAWDNNYWTDLGGRHDCPEVPAFNPVFVKRMNPDAKIIMILRDPVERAYSDYAYFNQRNISQDMFHQAVTDYVHFFTNCVKGGRTVTACAYTFQKPNGHCSRTEDGLTCAASKGRLYIGIYHVYIEQWLKHFNRDNFYFVLFENYLQDVKGTLTNIFTFLQLPELSDEKLATIAELDKYKNSNQKKKDKLGAMWPETRKLLQEFYLPHNRLLAKLLNDDNFYWNYPNT